MGGYGGFRVSWMAAAMVAMVDQCCALIPSYEIEKKCKGVKC